MTKTKYPEAQRAGQDEVAAHDQRERVGQVHEHVAPGPLGLHQPVAAVGGVEVGAEGFAVGGQDRGAEAGQAAQGPEGLERLGEDLEVASLSLPLALGGPANLRPDPLRDPQQRRDQHRQRQGGLPRQVQQHPQEGQGCQGLAGHGDREGNRGGQPFEGVLVNPAHEGPGPLAAEVSPVEAEGLGQQPPLHLEHHPVDKGLLPQRDGPEQPDQGQPHGEVGEPQEPEAPEVLRSHRLVEEPLQHQRVEQGLRRAHQAASRQQAQELAPAPFQDGP